MDQQAANKPPLFAATAGEKSKHYSYKQHNDKCIADGSTDPKLNIRMIPLVFEAQTGTAGKEMLQLMKGVRNHHRAYILPFDDRYEAAIFQKNWIHRISTSLQFGTARMIHNIPLGNRAKTRISKEEYGERIQAIENGENRDSEDETDEEVEDIILMEKEKNKKKQDEQPIVREISSGGIAIFTHSKVKAKLKALTHMHHNLV